MLDVYWWEVPGEADWSYHATAVVSEAVGMTMEYLNCSSLAALDALNAQSEQTGESLVAVAIDVIDRRYRPDRR